MVALSATTTRNSALSKTSTRGSTVTRTSTHDSSRRKSGIFSKLKQAFGKNGSRGSAASNDASSTFSRDTDGGDTGSRLAVPGTQRRRRRSSVFTLSRGSRDTASEAERERELEERKSRCMAIKVAKRDPPVIQRLLVDCEFCNPPPSFGRDIEIASPELTAESVAAAAPVPEGASAENELTWNTGLATWTRLREWWLAPTAHAVPVHHLEPDLSSDKFYTVYDKMVYQTRPLKHPLNLDDMLQIVKAGWVGEGTWPAQDDPNDVWSTSDAEEIQEHAAAKEQARRVEDGAIRSCDASLAGNTYASAGSSVFTPGESIKVSSPAPTIGHVQFSELPHPKDGGDLQPAISGSRENLPRLERLQSGYGSSLKPTRSNQSSLVSLTDSD